MLLNEEQISSEGDLDKMRWLEHPSMDSLGASVASTHAFQVGTRGELAKVLEFAREEKMLVRPAGALTSSKAYVAPPQSFMDHHGRRGVVLVGFKSEGEFGRINVDLDREEVTVGAAVSLQAMDDEVARVSSVANGSTRPRLANLMKITTMGASAVATALGSGGVSDAGESAISLMTGSRWVDGRGILHRENYDPRGYFNRISSTFARVDHRQIGAQMTGRGGPFGIGLEARFKLAEAPVSSNTVVYPFYGSREEALAALEEFTVSMNTLSDRLKAEQSPIQVQSLELMDSAAMEIASEGMSGWKPAINGRGDLQFAVIADFAQFDFLDRGESAWSANTAIEQAFEQGLVPEAFYETATPIDGEAAEKLRAFRLQGPEHIRMKYKDIRSRNPQAASESTDFAVDPKDPNLVRWYFDHFFRIHQAVQPHMAVQALYGHLLNRLDLHHRVVLTDPAQMRAHNARLTSFGQEVVLRQKNGEKVRVRGEKVELPTGRDLILMGMQRDGAHRDANVELLNRIDPGWLYGDRAPERWGGRYDYR